MFGLIGLKLYAAIGALVAGLLVLAGIAWWFYDTGKAAQLRQDEPVMRELRGTVTRLEGEVAAAGQVNDRLRQSVDDLGPKLQTCAQQVEVLSRPSEAARADIAAARIAAEKRAKLLEANLAALRRQAKTVSTGTAEAKCAAADATLTELAKHMREVLGFDDGPAPTLRISK